MKRIYRIILLVVLAGVILLGAGFLIPATAKYFSPQPTLPVLPTFVYQTLAPTTTRSVETMTHAVGTLITVTAAPSATPTNTSIPVVATATSTTYYYSGQSSSPAPTATQAVFQSCYNVLYPVKAGQQWLYQVSAQGRSLQVGMNVTSVSGQRGNVEVSNQATGIVSHATVECDNDIILNFPWMVVGMLFGDQVNGTVNTQYVSGVLAPSQSAFLASNWGLSWKGEYRVSGTGKVRFRGQDFDLVLNDSPLQLTCTTTAVGDAAFQSITVPAGYFARALKVVCTAVSQGAGTVNGQTVSGVVTGRTTQWFAPNVGLLKLQVDSTDINVLGLISIPLTVDGHIELIRFQPGS
jgi:hypothetical protein